MNRKQRRALNAQGLHVAPKVSPRNEDPKIIGLRQRYLSLAQEAGDLSYKLELQKAELKAGEQALQQLHVEMNQTDIEIGKTLNPQPPTPSQEAPAPAPEATAPAPAPEQAPEAPQESVSAPVSTP